MKPKTPKTAAPSSALTSDFKIEKGVPVPPRKLQCGITSTMKQMDIGDSIFIPFVTDDKKAKSRLQSNISARSIQLRSINGFHFTTRRVTGGLRVWRIEPATK